MILLISPKHTASNRRRMCVAAATLSMMLLTSGALLAAEKAVPVAVTTVTRAQLFEEVPLTGTVNAPQSAALSSRRDGLVLDVLADAGDRVNKGDVLLQLDDTLARINVASAQAAVQEANATLLESRRREAEAARLVKSKHIPATNYEAAQAQVSIDQAALARARADLARANEELERHTMRAPFTGVVARKLTEAGEWVDTGGAVLELIATRRLRVEIPVPQNYYPRVSQGAPVLLRFDAHQGERQQAQISRIVPVTNLDSRSFLIHVDIDNSAGRLAPGMSARAILQLGESSPEGVTVVPRDAVVDKPGGRQVVWVLRKVDGQPVAEPLEVRTGNATYDMIEVETDTLKVGDQIIVRGNERLRPGQLVIIKETDSARPG